MRKSLLEDTDFIRSRKGKIAIEEGRGCARCGATEGVELEDSRTQYHYEGEPGSEEDPNKPIPLCRLCAIEHHEYWDEMWREYYGGRI